MDERTVSNVFGVTSFTETWLFSGYLTYYSVVPFDSYCNRLRRVSVPVDIAVCTLPVGLIVNVAMLVLFFSCGYSFC